MSRTSLQRSRPSSSDSFAAQVDAWHERMHLALARRLPPADETPACLNAALRSWVLDREERTHPILMFAVGRTVGLRDEQIEVAACALELLHLFVEVHRSLPALAVGERTPATHPALRAYDEATLLLVGDSLPPLAFNLICVDPGVLLAPRGRLQLAAMLASAMGSRGRLGTQITGAAEEGADQFNRADRSEYCTGVRLAIACRDRPPDRAVRALLGDFERALAVSWAEAFAVLPRRGAQTETLRRVTRWLAERESERRRDERK